MKHIFGAQQTNINKLCLDLEKNFKNPYLWFQPTDMDEELFVVFVVCLAT